MAFTDKPRSLPALSHVCDLSAVAKLVAKEGGMDARALEARLDLLEQQLLAAQAQRSTQEAKQQTTER